MTAFSTTLSDITAVLGKALNRVDLSVPIARQAERIATERFPHAEVSIVPTDQASVEIMVDRMESREELK